MADKPPRSLLPLLTGILLVLLLLWAVIFPLQAYLSGRAKAEKVFSQALLVIEKRALKSYTPEELLPFAMGGLVIGLKDPHADYIDAATYRRLLDFSRGMIVGIGVHVEKRGGQILISSVLPASPAEKAGLRAGDRILEVDSKDISTAPIEDISSAIHGQEGTKLRMLVLRNGKKLSVVVTRARIHMPPATYTDYRHGIGCLRVAYFPEGVAKETAELLRGKRFGALIVDLRDNPGGDLQEGVRFADLFLSEGVILKTLSRADGERTYRATKAASDILCPLALVVNSGTASAAEFVAAALSVQRKAPIIGEKTFGKGTVIETYPLADGSAITITTAEYLTPDGQHIEGKGLQPTVRAFGDPLEAALSILEKK